MTRPGSGRSDAAPPTAPPAAGSGAGAGTVTLVAAAIGLLLATVVLVRRNLYEDEWLSLAYIQRPVLELWRWTLEVGCHPPGALVLDRLALLALGSPLGVAALHALVWSAGTALFVLRAQHLLRGSAGRWAFALVAFLHPQTIMWAGTVRWYGVWWGVALGLLAVALLPPRDAREPSWARTGVVGLTAALLFYLDHVAVIFLPCLAVAWLVRYGITRASLARIAAVAGLCAALAWPVVSALPRQRGLEYCRGEAASPLAALFHLLHGMSVGQAVLPWHPVAVVAALGLFLPCGVWLFRELVARRRGAGPAAPAAGRELAALATFLALMLAGAIASGLGTKPRSFLGLVVLVTLGLVMGAERIRSRAGRAWVVALTVLWIATGAVHLVGRTGTAKRQLNDRPEQLIARLEQIAGGEPALVLTDNLVLTFEIDRRRARGRTPLVLCSTWNDPVFGFPAGLPADAPLGRVIVVTEVGAMGPASGREALAVSRRMIADERTEDFGADADWRLKSRLTGMPLEPYRFRIWHGRARSADWEAVRESFAIAAGQTILGDGS